MTRKRSGRPQRHLVIFARFPQAGAGKRRLAADVGAVEALRFQRTRLKALTLRHGSDPRWHTWLAVTPDRSGPWPRHVSKIGQGRGDLGQRMGRVMRVLPPGPVLLVGTDIPGITSALLARGFARLGASDAVFGPASDGGYWLVGLRRRPRLVLPFAGVRWSTPHALADTTRNLDGASIARIDTLDDVDDARSLREQINWARVCHAPVRFIDDGFAKKRVKDDDSISARNHGRQWSL